MATDCIAQVTFEFQGLRSPVVARFDQAHASSDGGALLLKALDDRLGLTQRLTASLTDRRQAGKVQHELIELVRQRVYGIACGYADCNDAARLAQDPVHKLLLERDPLAGPPLASQPTLSRFENAVDRPALYLASVALADLVIEHHRARLQGRARRITIDVDPTDDPTHGQQEFTFFNGHYDTWCYLPLVATLTFNTEPTQYLVAAVLRPGNSPAKRGAPGVLARLLRRLRVAFPGAVLRVRLDGGFASPEVLDFLEAEAVEYIVAMGANARLVKRSRRLMGRARVLSKASGETEHLFGETRYAARKWRRKRRVIMKAEVVRHPGRTPKNNPRFVVTNLAAPPERVWPVLLRAGRHGEPPQGTASRAGHGPDELRAVHGQPVPSAPDRHRVHPLPDPADLRRGHGLCRRPGQHAARAAAQARRLGRALGAPDRAASAHHLSLASHLAADRRGRRRDPRIVAAPAPAVRSSGRRVSPRSVENLP